MIGVLKKELRVYRVTMLGYVFSAFLLAAVGLYFSFNNLNLASPRFESVLKSIHFVFLVFVPILTMRVFAEERRQKTDQLLLTLPLRSVEIVLGKYFALLILYALPMALVCTYPLILCRYGKINLPVAYFSILGFFLLGCVYLAIGILGSMLTESPVIAAVITFAALLFTYTANTISRMIPNTAKGSLVAFLTVIAILAVCCGRLTRHMAGPVLAGMAGGGALCFLFFTRRVLLEGSFQKFLSLFFLNGRLDGFYDGFLDIPALLYYLSLTVFVLCLASVKLDRQRQASCQNAADGIYDILSLVILTAGIVLVNCMAARLPDTMICPDFSTEKLSSLTDNSKELLKTVQEPVSLTLICEGGKEDDTVLRLLRRYEEENPLVSFREVDPALYPGFVSRYTESRLPDNSIIVAGESRSRVISADDLYTIGTSAMTGRRVETGFDGEGLVTSAIAYVLSDRSFVFYALQANKESAPGDSFREAAKKNNIEIRPLNLMAEEVPDDAAGLLMAAPQTDYTEAETDKILSYLEKGGKACILSNFSLDAMPSFDRILENYGLFRREGIILEGDDSRYISYQYCLIPSVMYSTMTQGVYQGSYLLLPMAQGIGIRETFRDSIRHTPLLLTSDKSYEKADVENMSTSEKEDGDAEGPFTVGMLAEEDIDNDGRTDTELVYFSSGYLLDEDYNQNVAGGNARLFGDCLKVLAGEAAGHAAVPIKNMVDSVLAITDYDANVWTVLCVFVLPLAVVLSGGVICFGRRRR